MKLIYLFPLLLVSCGSVEGIRVTADSINIAGINGVGEDTSGEYSEIEITNTVASVSIKKGSQIKNQSNSTNKIGNVIITTGVIKAAGKVAEQGIDSVTEMVTQ